MSEKAIVVASNVSKVYKSGVGEVRAVDNLSFEVNEGEFVVILGHERRARHRRRKPYGNVGKGTDAVPQDKGGLCVSVL